MDNRFVMVPVTRMPTTTESLPPANSKKIGIFTLPDGRNLVVTFFLVASLFLLWGFCNGMIDTMDKHFQDQLHLNKAQSAWVQFAHYMGYALMALPAGLLTRKFGYKGGIIFGLILVACGGFWFMPATKIQEFWAFLLGVCVIAMGLTVLETVANPYTTVLGPKEAGSLRINLAQAFNGVGWMLGPYIGGKFFYSEGGADVAKGQLYIPYLGVGIVVLVLAALFFFARVPDIKVEDEYHTDEKGTAAATMKAGHPGVIFLLTFLNVVALGLSIGLVCHTILPAVGVPPGPIKGLTWGIVIAVALSAPFLFGASKKITEHSIWAHPHFAGATLSQFLYVAAQAGIFSFFINYVISEMPAISHSVANMWPLSGHAVERSGGLFVNEQGASALQGWVAFGLFTLGRFVGAALLKRKPAHKLLGTYCVINALLCGVVMLRLGWISTAAVFGTFFFMSIGFPTTFALGIFGLGSQAKKRASAFIVMSITGGALMPKLMGHLGDVYNMSIAFLMPLCCFILMAVYSFSWSKLSRSEGLVGMKAGSGH
jgi:FHS family L-fucose permease-like MFS transporter